MFASTFPALRSRLVSFGLRLKLRDLPPLATHLLMFLLGTLLIKPEVRLRIPQSALVPLAREKIQGEVRPLVSYRLVSKKEGCRLTSSSLRIWQPEPDRAFLQLGKGKEGQEQLRHFQKTDSFLQRDEGPIKSCSRGIDAFSS